MNSSFVKSTLNDEGQFFIDDSGKSKAYFSISKPTCVDKDIITELKREWEKNPDRNLRICLHDSPKSLFHEMIILETPGKYYRPHKHTDKGESYHLIEGQLGVIVFSDDGSVLDARILDINDQFLYRIGDSVFHCIMPLTFPVIYHESKLGPFKGKGDSVWAPWSPPENDEISAGRFIKEIKETYFKNQQFS